jgi:hypothetical protein
VFFKRFEEFLTAALCLKFVNQGVQREQQENQGGVTGVNENCVDKIMDFLENTLKIEDTKF